MVHTKSISSIYHLKSYFTICNGKVTVLLSCILVIDKNFTIEYLVFEIIMVINALFTTKKVLTNRYLYHRKVAFQDFNGTNESVS